MNKDINSNAIVRIISFNTHIDWRNPYKISDASESVGTGFFISKSGLLLTCFHVVEDSIKVYINIPDQGKKKYKVKIIKICPKLDMALLKVIGYEPTNILSLGNSDCCISGLKVTALGYPMGFQQLKYTSGIISGRTDGLLQTDSPINPGNSGGPLVNDKNEVIGINSSGISPSAADGIGFAIPIYNINVLLDNNLHKLIKTPFFGCFFINCSNDYFRGNNVSELISADNGIIVSGIVNDTPISNSGIKNGDILLTFDNHIIDNFGFCKVPWNTEKEHIKYILMRYKENSLIEIKYHSLLKKKFIKTNINFNKHKKFVITTVFPKYEKKATDHEIIAGIILMNLRVNHIGLFENGVGINLVKYLFLKNKREPKLIIVNILKGGEISKLETLNGGDLIKKINGKEINDLEQFRELLKSLIINDFIKIETELDNVAYISVKNTIEDDHFLSKKYHYNISPHLKRLY